ncbi:hypothetical protein GWI33_017283 [Rhynchophorus ferrugineus]|uniref:Uncharacterized protein n=1 Tax=Rhynchophorus ferrugineus TaxID=354439 RepID=A0A834M9A9_RHYFE|nr:hypothetical protein GWI33_017283 [Rhynchophorus ferrugineus]
MNLIRISVLTGSSYCGCSGSVGLSHPETLTVTLTADRGLGYGLTVSVGDHSENRSADILITRIAPDSPAYRDEGNVLIRGNIEPKTWASSDGNSTIKENTTTYSFPPPSPLPIVGANHGKNRNNSSKRTHNLGVRGGKDLAAARLVIASKYSRIFSMWNMPGAPKEGFHLIPHRRLLILFRLSLEIRF